MNESLITIMDKARGRLVEAELLDDLSAGFVRSTEAAWKQQRSATSVQHAHWDWGRKSENLALLAYRCFGIKCQGDVQGLMMVNTAVAAQMEPDRTKPLVYIAFLESAPWNLKELSSSPRYGLIGGRLIEASVRLSLNEGFAGRIGLHSLPQSEPFYQSIGMVKSASTPRRSSTTSNLRNQVHRTS